MSEKLDIDEPNKFYNIGLSIIRRLGSSLILMHL